MTVIVGITNGTDVYIGGDRGASDDVSIVSMYRPKVHVNNDWAFGYAGSLGVGQLMEIIDIPSIKKNQDPYKILRTDVVSHMRNAIDLYGNSDPEYSADFIIGTQGRLFEFSTIDWSVAEVRETAIGSGNAFALGSLYTSIGMRLHPEDRIRMALNAAITYSPTCQGGMDIINV